MSESFDYKSEFEKTGNEKYVLDTEDTKETFSGHTLYRIIYKDGSKGGWLESYENLSQDGNCKVLDEAMVYNNAWVYGDAQIYGNAWVCGFAEVSENAEVYDGAEVYDYAQVYGAAKVYGEAQVYDEAKVYDEAWINGIAEICGNAVVDYDVSEGKITE